MKKIYSLLFVLASALGLNAQLNPGDIAFVQYNADGAEIIKFIAFVEIPAGEVISFTDNGWFSSGAFRTGEGTDVWTSPGVSCGDIVTVDLMNTALSGTGDQLIAYQGTEASPTIITALNSEGAGIWQADATNANTSALPTGLVNGTSAVALNEIDNAKYTGAILTGTIAALKAAIHDNNNWSGDNSTEQDFTDVITLTDCPSTSTPSISSTSTNVLGLDYVFGTGPSAIDSFELSGANLTGAVSGTAITNFEFSLNKTVWSTFPGTVSGPLINLTPIKIYVRLAAPPTLLPVNTYSETITLSSAGASDLLITFTGEVTAPPCVSSLQTLPFNGIAGNTNLNHDNANPPAPGPVEVCGSNYFIGYTSTPSTDSGDNEFGTESAQTPPLVGLSSVDFGGEGTFRTFPIDVSTVAAVNIETFGNTSGTGVFTGTGEYLEWWYSLDGGPRVVFFSTTADGSLADLESALDVTGVNQIEVGFTFNMNGGGDGFENMDVVVEEFNPNLPNIMVDTTLMNGFTYVEGAGPSASQTNTLEWANLTASVTSGNVVNFFEFSVDAGVSWNDATVLNVTIPPFPGTSPGAIPVLVRLKELLLTGVYRDTVVLASLGADTVNVFLEGEVTIPPAADCSQLFISEYGEPNGGSDKYIEIYNPSPSAVNLSNYEVWIISNGGSWPESSIGLSGSLASGEAYVIANTTITNPNVDLANNTVTGFNGNDAVGLAFDAGSGFVLIDAVGEDGSDPGASGWDVAGVNGATSNNILIRKASVKIPNTDWDNSRGTNASDSEWEVISYNGGDALPNLGVHSSSCISNINTWTGLVDTDWNTVGNWSRNAVPSIVDSVVIPTSPIGSNFPLTSTNITVLHLDVQAGATLDITPTFGLILLEGADNSGTITLNSDASGTAWLDEFSNGATYAGDITVETFVTTGSGLGQRYFGIPVASASIQGLDGTYTGFSLGQLIPTSTCDPNQLDPASPYSNLFQWNENATFPSSCVQEGWEAINASANLTPARAYSGWMNDGSVISVTGTPNLNDVVLSTSGATLSLLDPGYVANAHGWHLLANPFPSPLSVASVINSGFTSPQTYNGGSGAFSGTFNSILTSGDDLAIMQGFVAESTTGSVYTAAAADRVAGNELWLKPNFTHMLEITVLGNGMGDKTHVYYDFDATNQFDPAGDCKKRESDFGHPTLFTNLNGDKMSLNGFDIEDMERTVGLGLMPGADGTFTLSFDGIASFPSTSLIFLEDKLTGGFVNLREINSYMFQASTNDNEDRFEIHFTAPISIETTEASCDGGDAEIMIDFGTSAVNNNAVTWDYTLSSNGLPMQTINAASGAVTVNALEEGNYNLNFSFGNYSVDIPVEVLGLEKVNADFTSYNEVVVGTELTIANLSAGANSFEWYVEGLTTQNVDLTHTFSNIGLVDIVLTASNEDCEASKVKTIKVLDKTTGIRNVDLLAGASVYESNGAIVVDLTKVNLSSNTKVEVFNLLGQLIRSEEMGNTQLKMNMGDAKSYFFVKLTNQSKQKVFKILLK